LLITSEQQRSRRRFLASCGGSALVSGFCRGSVGSGSGPTSVNSASSDRSTCAKGDGSIDFDVSTLSDLGCDEAEVECEAPVEHRCEVSETSADPGLLADAVLPEVVDLRQPTDLHVAAVALTAVGLLSVAFICTQGRRSLVL